MRDYIKHNWIYLLIATCICSIFIFTKFNDNPESRNIEVQTTPQPKPDSIIAIIDSTLKIKKELEEKKDREFKRKQTLLEEELRKEKQKKKRQTVEKTKVVVETKEIIVEKEVYVPDKNSKKVLMDNYKIQEENAHLKEEIECLRKSNKPQKDSISTDTVKKKRRFFFF